MKQVKLILAMASLLLLLYQSSMGQENAGVGNIKSDSVSKKLEMNDSIKALRGHKALINAMPTNPEITSEKPKEMSVESHEQVSFKKDGSTKLYLIAGFFLSISFIGAAFLFIKRRKPDGSTSSASILGSKYKKDLNTIEAVVRDPVIADDNLLNTKDVVTQSMEKTELLNSHDEIVKKSERLKTITENVIVPKSQAIHTADWLIVGGSAIGKSHIANNLPCQDSFCMEEINSSWGIAVCCDGAGSAALSHIGSSFVAKEAAKVFRAITLEKCDIQGNKLIAQSEWKELAKAGLYQVRMDMEKFAVKEGYNLGSLACTVIVVVYSPGGLLVAHIGDGRAAYMDSDKNWKSILEPWKGDEANQTVFITSAIWNSQVDSFVKSNVIEGLPAALTLMTDGCETHSFECSLLDKETNLWSDPNRPFEKFFNPLRDTLIQFKRQDLANAEILAKWTNFLEGGTPGLKNESDDKTMILGVYTHNLEKPV